MFDFDYWKELNEKDPQRFEQERADLLKNEIKKANSKKQLKLQALQSKINIQCRKSKNPMNSFVLISDMMWSSFNQMSNLLNELRKH